MKRRGDTHPEPELLEFRRETVARLTRAGYTAPDIAIQLGVTTRTVQRYRRITGASRNLCTPMTTEEIDFARALLEDGASYGEVARTLHRRACTISRRLPGYGWSVGSGGEYRRAMQQLDAIRPVAQIAVTA